MWVDEDRGGVWWEGVRCVASGRRFERNKKKERFRQCRWRGQGQGLMD
jgi:hypothetical protein